MAMRSRQNETWGVAIGEQGGCRVRLIAEGDGWRIDRAERGEASGAAGRLGVVLPDAVVLYRRSELPRAERATRNRLLAVQAEAALPLPDGGRVWGWEPAGEGAALLYVTRREHLDRLAGDVVERAGWIGPAALASAAGVALLGGAAEGRWLLVRESAGHTSLVVMRGSAIESAGGLDEPGDSPRWPRAVAERCEQLLSALAGEEPVASFLLLGEAGDGQAAALAAELEASPMALPGETARFDLPAAEVLAAAGAAARAAEPVGRSLAGEANEKGFEHSASGTGRRMALLGAWAVLAALGLFGLDHYRAVQAEAAAAALGKAAGGETQLERQLALGQYLQQGPAPPLMVLEEVARRLERKVVLSEWHYDREGEIRFGGAVGRFAEFEEMLRKLDALAMFEEVRLTSAAEEKRKWKFQIRATLAPAYRWQPARPKADTTEADQEGAK